MKTQTVWRWEQDGAGGEHGTATYFPGTPHEAIVSMRCFQDAHDLQLSIEDAIKQARHDARQHLLRQIASIRP